MNLLDKVKIVSKNLTGFVDIITESCCIVQTENGERHRFYECEYGKELIIIEECNDKEAQLRHQVDYERFKEDEMSGA